MSKSLQSGKCLVCLMLPVILLLFFPLSALAIENHKAPLYFPTTEAALEVLSNAVKAKDYPSLRAIFGPSYKDLDPGDPVQQAKELEFLAKNMEEGVELIKEGDHKAIITIGKAKWPFPVPLVKAESGWLFDTQAGRDEILTRRIGHNESLAIKACRAYVEAQREYYSMSEPDGVQIPKYAQRFISTPGRRNGLYWPTLPGAKESPLGPLIAQAKEQGYAHKSGVNDKGSKPFNGYYFRILTQQGESAPGGKFSYIINGNMVAGHALVAYPARWGVSGVMTFIVNQRGRVYQKNLGPKTAELARSMKNYNPDLSWKLVEDQ